MTTRVVICRSNPIAPDPRVEKAARILTEAGYTVTVLGWDRTGELPTEETHRRVSIRRLPIRAEFGKGLMNLPQLLRWQRGLLGWLIRHRRSYDIIHACDFDTVLPAMFMKTLWGKSVVYDIFDFYADHLRATPELLKAIIRAIDLRVINQVDAVILVDVSRKAQIQGARPKLLEIIYNSPEDVQEEIRTNQKLSREGRLHLAYIGLMQVERGLVELLEVLESHPEWTLDLAGFGGDQDMILERGKHMPNLTWHGRVSYERALQLSHLADALIATYDPAIPNHRFSSPNKVFEAMLFGKPIIVARDTNMDQLIEAVDCGIVVTYGDCVELEGALSCLSTDLEFRTRLGQNARKAYESTYSWSQMGTRLLNLYEKVRG